MDSVSQPETISMPRIGDKAPAFKAATTQAARWGSDFKTQAPFSLGECNRHSPHWL